MKYSIIRSSLLIAGILSSAAAFSSQYVMRAEVKGVSESPSTPPIEVPAETPWVNANEEPSGCGDWLPEISNESQKNDFTQSSTCQQKQTRTNSSGELEIQFVSVNKTRDVAFTAGEWETISISAVSGELTTSSSWFPAIWRRGGASYIELKGKSIGDKIVHSIDTNLVRSRTNTYTVDNVEFEGGIETESKIHSATAIATINSVNTKDPKDSYSYSPTFKQQGSLSNSFYNLVRLNGDKNIFTFEYEQDEVKTTNTETNYNISWDFDKAIPASSISSLSYFGKTTNGDMLLIESTNSIKKNTVTVNVNNYSSSIYNCIAIPEANTIPEGQQFTQTHRCSYTVRANLHVEGQGDEAIDMNLAVTYPDQDGETTSQAFGTMK